MSAREAQHSISSSRCRSLDAMRGLAVAGMILVNNPGSWTDSYGFLAHAAWDGWTLADLVFPFFLLIVGASIDLSLSRRLATGARARAVFPGIARRALMLCALGIILNAFPYSWDLASVRVFGVLQRIAACYLVGSTIFLLLGAWGQAATAGLLLVAYWMLMTLVPVPGYGAGVLALQGNLAGYVDSRLFPGHLYLEGFDPEGLLSTLPAIATTLLGMLAGRCLRSPVRPLTKTLALGLGGAALVGAGALLDRWFPINKQLWTSSFVLLSGGFGLLMLATCHELIDRRRWCLAPAAPFVVLGSNALAVYVLSSLGGRMMEVCKVSVDSGSESLRLFLYSHLFAPWAGVVGGSLLFSTTYLLLWMLTAAELYRRHAFIRI